MATFGYPKTNHFSMRPLFKNCPGYPANPYFSHILHHLQAGGAVMDANKWLLVRNKGKMGQNKSICGADCIQNPPATRPKSEKSNILHFFLYNNLPLAPNCDFFPKCMQILHSEVIKGLFLP